jgi:acyl-coenzyme A thioesterase PaaI-like protein
MARSSVADASIPITRRGRSILFCQAEVRAVDTGDVVAEGWMTYKVSAPRTGAATNGAT